MTVQAAYQELIIQLSSIYEKREAENIADWVMEHLTGWKKMERVMNKEQGLATLQMRKLEQYIKELLQHRPVQYVLGEAWFAGMRFFVNEDVLIPRPETEELVEMIATGGRILDIGTGSGCIPIALKKKYPAAEIFACDISEAALQIARHNSQANEAAVQFIQYDILNKNDWDKLPKVDIIVSNPPYIPEKDKGTMHKNVLNNEPHQALFVPDNDPLIFYKTIAELTPVLSAKTIYLEIHEEQGNPVVQLLKDRNFTNIELKRDMQGKERMIKGAFCSS